jgi:hypothetical protein
MTTMSPNHAANPAIASRLQSNALVGRVAELGSLGHAVPSGGGPFLPTGFPQTDNPKSTAGPPNAARPLLLHFRGNSGF